MADENTNTPDQPPATLQPMIRVKDVGAAIQTYTKAGATKVMEVPGPDGKTLAHGIVAFGNSFIHVSPVHMAGIEASPDYDAEYEKTVQKGPRGLGVIFYVNTTDVERRLQNVEAAGFEIRTGIVDQFWGDRTFVAVDPFGYGWSFAQTVKAMTPQEMLEAMQELKPTST